MTTSRNRDRAVLCDTTADGTVTQFVRNYIRDKTGMITGHTDRALNGRTPYTPTGTVAAYEAEALSPELGTDATN